MEPSCERKTFFCHFSQVIHLRELRVDEVADVSLLVAEDFLGTVTLDEMKLQDCN